MNNELMEFRTFMKMERNIWASFFVTSDELCQPDAMTLISVQSMLVSTILKIYASVSPFNLNRAKS